MFRTTAIALFLASASVVNGRELCYDNYDLINLNLPAGECRWMNIFNAIKDQFKENRKENKIKCSGGPMNEIMALTGTETQEDAREEVKNLCDDALLLASEVYDENGWETVQGAGVDLEKFYKGTDFLNTETGNFQQDLEDFEDEGGEDKFLHISTDPRGNDHYPTSEESYVAGLGIRKMYDEESRKSFFDSPTSNFECESNLAMCCWHRDRQYFDGNGSCNTRDCVKENPGDNTDLCWTEADGEIFPYPGDNTEGNLHCHGFGWTNELQGMDINTKGRFNTLFYVSMYDHMVQRGYVESITNDSKIAGVQDMCGCVEKMNPVARADCSELVGTTEYTVTVSDGSLVVEPVEGTFDMNFQACQGIKYIDNYTPEDYVEDLLERDTEHIEKTSNDLAGFAFKQYLTKKIDEDQYDMFKDTVVGYHAWDIQNGSEADDNRETVCKKAYVKKFGTQYKEKVVE